MMKITAVQIDPPKLHKTIVTHFGLDELHDLCFDLTLDFDELPPGGKSAKARGLVEMCQRRKQLVALAEAVLEHRNNIQPNEFLRDLANDDAPFKGLLAFEEADEEIFFGREDLTAELVARVFQPPGGSAQQPDPSTNLREVFPPPTNFLAIVGASGSGKSSVVRAGMIPKLRRQTNWPIHLITPTAHPLQALATSLTRDSESVTATATLIDDLQKEPRAFRLYAARLLENSKAERLLLVIDQFEELFTLCKNEAERTAFVENLVHSVAEGDQIIILLTLRADFYHHCLQFEPLHRLLEQQQKIVPMMSGAELRAAIELPAQQANLTFADGLVDILLRDVGAADNQVPEPGALPLLSHALLETWQRRDPTENRLTLAGYTEAGGVQGAIAKTAESTYQRLPVDQQKIARSIFLRLTELGEGTQDTRRRATLTELLPPKDERATVEKVLKTLADARLLTTNNDGAEVAHEALIRQWPMLQSWLDEDREGLRFHRQLTEAALAWETNKRDASYLYRGGRLTQFREWLEAGGPQLNQLEADFLQISQKKEADELAKVREIAAERTRASRFLRVALFLADLFAIAFLVFLLQAQENSEAADQQRKLALTQSAAALSNVVLEQDNDTELAALLAIEGARLNWHSGGRVDWLIDNNLRSFLDTQIYFNNTLEGHGSSVWSVAISPDGKTLATGSDDRIVRLWDLRDPSAAPTVLSGHESSILSVAFSPDGETFASSSSDRTVRLWDLRDPSAEPTVLRGHESSIWSIAFSPDGKTLASGSADQTIRLWDLSDPSALPTILSDHEDWVLSVAFSPDGKTLASGSSDRSVRLWQLSDLSVEPRMFQGHESNVRSVTFSQDGNTLASGDAIGIIWLWDLSDLSAAPTVLRGNRTSIWSLAFSPDGETLASGSDDQTIRLWDLSASLIQSTVLRGHESSVRAVVFSPDGKTLVSSSSDRTVRLWDMSVPSAAPTVLRGHESSVRSVAFSPDGDNLASGGDDRTVRLWDLSDSSAAPTVLQGHDSSVWSVAFSPDVDILASGGDDRTVRLWDLSDLSAAPIVLQGHDSSVRSVAFSPNGESLASGSDDQTIRLWNLRDPLAMPIILLGHESSVLSVAFSPDGKVLASGSSDRTIRLWDLSEPSSEPGVLALLLGHEDRVRSVTFSPDGQTLASGSDDRTIMLWNLGNSSEEPTRLTGHDSSVLSVAFSPSGGILASGSSDQTARLWDLSALSAEPTVFQGHEASIWSVTFSPDGNILVSGGEDQRIRLWVFLEELVEIGCQKVRRNLSWGEWQRYFPGEPYRQTCPNLPPHPSVPVSKLP